MTAMTAATIDQLSGGRMILGLGSSGPQVAEGWHGQRFARQLQRTREYVEVVRMALARERVVYRGETLELPLPGRPGKALKLTIAPVQERIPIYLAAIGPRNTALAGEIADGWLPTFFSPEHVGRLPRSCSRRGPRAPGGRSRVRHRPEVSVHISDDLDAARNFMRPGLALYVGGMGSREQNFYNGADGALRLRATRPPRSRTCTSPASGRRPAAALPDELIDMVSLCGPRDVSPSDSRPTATRASAR